MYRVAAYIARLEAAVDGAARCHELNHKRQAIGRCAVQRRHAVLVSTHRALEDCSMTGEGNMGGKRPCSRTLSACASR